MNKNSSITYYLEALIKLMRISPNWISAVVSRFITKKPIRVHIMDDINFLFNPKNQADLTMMVEVFWLECYCPPFLEIWENDIVFDIWAHVGYFSIYASRKCKNGRVFSFEPMSTNYSALQEHILWNNWANISPANIAVWGEDGEADFFMFAWHNGCHSLYKRQPDQKTIQVKKKKLETIINELQIDFIDFLKLDCEGAEYEIFDGMSSETFWRIGKVSMEIHSDIIEWKSWRDIISRLHKEWFIAVESKGFIYAINKNILK